MILIPGMAYRIFSSHLSFCKFVDLEDVIHPGKLKIRRWMEDDFPFQLGVFRWTILIFRGVLLMASTGWAWVNRSHDPWTCCIQILRAVLLHNISTVPRSSEGSCSMNALWWKISTKKHPKNKPLWRHNPPPFATHRTCKVSCVIFFCEFLPDWNFSLPFS